MNRRSLKNPKPHLLLRARIFQSIREFFISRGYLEIETPQLITAPAPETHIESISIQDRYLQTSPELCMKRLLSAGFPKIFQIARCFRGGERGDLHLPEFSLLEWYRTGIDYRDLMEECEALFLFLSRRLDMGTQLSRRGLNIDLDIPWERLPVQTAFERYASVSLEQALNNNRFDQTMVEEIEPHLGVKTPTFLYDYPASLAALARLKPGCPSIAERFEIYVGGIELANGFSELNDAHEQRKRFEKELKEKALLGKIVSPMPERFLKALKNMPEAAGIALGLDRLVMIFSGARTIDEVVAFTPEEV
ncbi:MAG: EF-P lysine aminoacylase GenX [Deltaproteobacteria bacterium]|jgi:elongation factor P--(R)-beta-lysine ligase|nr:EF-P lysine aminoacylase GenX [Deltaproteobacteria bacterium]